MGIPSYFSHIIRNYSNIIRGLQFFDENKQVIHHLLMDCNSIVYDAVRELETSFDEETASQFESNVIDLVIKRIYMYIKLIRPTKSVYIAFDGVAPFAKMDQQRNRRYKSSLNTRLDNDKSVPRWNTSSITPGTAFMNKLSDRVTYEFNYAETKCTVNKVYVSCSDKPGEGEHKLFDHMRHNIHSDEAVAIYGLDSDLIMLSIFHLEYCENIYVCREAPEFIKSSITIQTSSDNDLLFMDIKHFSHSILAEMKCVDHSKQRIYDYVFLCFLLGNDFLPHFPSLNIRTTGIQVIMDVYRQLIGSQPGKFIVSEKNQIQWNSVSKLIGELAKREHELLNAEYATRNKFEKRTFPESTQEEQADYVMSAPIIYRGIEQYICPSQSKWEDRYYKSLFHNNRTTEFIKQVCINYLEGLQWVMTYYSAGCMDWRWKYNYHYAPLLVDLYKYVPHFEMDFISTKAKKSNVPFSSNAQLAYVLPGSMLHIAPKPVSTFLKKIHPEKYPESYTLQWAFCRYLWEAHPLIPEISKTMLEQWEVRFDQ